MDGRTFGPNQNVIKTGQTEDLHPIDPEIVSRAEEFLDEAVNLRKGAEEFTETTTTVVTDAPQHLIVTLEQHLAKAREIRLRLKACSEQTPSI